MSAKAVALELSVPAAESGAISVLDCRVNMMLAAATSHASNIPNLQRTLERTNLLDFELIFLSDKPRLEIDARILNDYLVICLP
jgi:hypothetical protein